MVSTTSTPSRLGNYVNNGYSDICEAEDWPFLEATTSGAAPLTISDLRTIESVIDTTTSIKLRPMDRRNITDFDVDLTTSGSAFLYYITGGDVVNTYPYSTDTLSVNYWNVPDDLSGDTDEPVVPDRFRSLIVDAAVVYAYEDDDESNQADAANARYQSRLEQMKQSLMRQQHDLPDQWLQTGEWAAWGSF